MKPYLLDTNVVIALAWPNHVHHHEVQAGRPVLIGHRQISDAYLLALAAKRGGVLATFDRGLRPLAPGDRGTVEIISHANVSS
jgi:predicted nucleic acid-binding protein